MCTKLEGRNIYLDFQASKLKSTPAKTEVARCMRTLAPGSERTLAYALENSPMDSKHHVYMVFLGAKTEGLDVSSVKNAIN